MSDETLQIAFEIKTTCDEISRRLLRWHWEKKPGNHSLDSLLQHIKKRQQESPDYYDRLPDLSGKTSWQQLDTTLCMRVLLDPEKDASHPLDLLGNTAHPAAARRACNAVRTARNEAAHASDHNSCAQAAILFNEAIESLEEGYAGTAFKTAELEQYYRAAEDFLNRCGGSRKRRTSEETAPRRNTSSSNRNSSSGRPNSNNRKSGSGQSGNRNSSSQNSRNTAPKTNRNPRNNSRKNSRKKKQDASANRAIVIALLVIAALGLLIRALTMGN